LKLNNQLSEAVHNGLHQRFINVRDLKDFSPDDVKKGREFVKAYVEFMHYVKPIYEIAIKTVGHGHHNGEEGSGHEENHKNHQKN
jgi:hypothetical protein